MKALGIDTSYRYLNICLMEDGIVDAVQIECFKQQSEWMIPKWKELMEKNGWKPRDIDAIVITSGPGSYTGIRIAMTVGKVFASSMRKPLYTVSSLQLLAGSLPHAIALMDARGKRAYVGVYHHGQVEIADTIMTLEQVKALREAHPDYQVVGEGSLLGEDDRFTGMERHFDDLRPFWKSADPVDFLQPVYLKDNDAYMV